MKKIVPYILDLIQKQNYKDIILVLLIIVSLAAISSLLPVIYKLVMDNMLSVKIENNNNAIIFAWLYGCVFITSQLIVPIKNALSSKIFLKLEETVLKDFFKGINFSSFITISDISSGVLINYIDRAQIAIKTLFHCFIFDVLPNILGFAITLIILLKIVGIKYLLILIGCMVLYITVSIFMQKRIVQFLEKVNVPRKLFATMISDTIRCQELVKSGAKEDEEIRSLSETLRDRQEKEKELVYYFAKINFIQNIISSFAVFIVFFTAVLDVSKQTITIGEFVMINAYVLGFFSPVQFIGHLIKDFSNSIFDITNVFHLLTAEQPVIKSNCTPNFSLEKKCVIYKNVFCVINKTKVLNNVSFTILPSTFNAVVGKSGSGKSMAVKLLLGLYDIEQGDILFDRMPITSYSKNDVNTKITIAPQNDLFFNNTIMYNLSYFLTNKDERAVIDLCKKLGIHSWISSLPQGYNSNMGENGINLSGGQKQQLSIIRALLKDADIIILDESTSKLDYITEHLILQNIRKTFSNKTIVFIAHRLYNIVGAANIIVFDKNYVVEQGTHEVLLNNKGHYHKLWSVRNPDHQKEIIDIY